MIDNYHPLQETAFDIQVRLLFAFPVICWVYFIISRRWSLSSPKQNRIDMIMAILLAVNLVYAFFLFETIGAYRFEWRW